MMMMVITVSFNTPIVRSIRFSLPKRYYYNIGSSFITSSSTTLGLYGSSILGGGSGFILGMVTSKSHTTKL